MIKKIEITKTNINNATQKVNLSKGRLLNMQDNEFVLSSNLSDKEKEVMEKGIEIFSSENFKDFANGLLIIGQRLNRFFDDSGIGFTVKDKKTCIELCIRDFLSGSEDIISYSVENSKYMLEQLYKKAVEKAPEHAEEYEKLYRQLLEKLDQ